ncbi:unnamed protein product, partial [Effrenium voratum]
FDQVKAKLEMGEVAKWPLLIYLQGSGGGTFFFFCQHARHAEGARFAAEHFITVSPKCCWGWKSSPDAWVLDLVEELCKAPYVDSSRVYLTGVSMGGMGCWELAMQRPELFAAVVPVAAYHKPALRSKIAEALSSTPIFAVHSSKDKTCPPAKEKLLYAELQNFRADLRVDECTLAHTAMQRAFIDDSQIYEWLLCRSRKPQALRRWGDKKRFVACRVTRDL